MTGLAQLIEKYSMGTLFIKMIHLLLSQTFISAKKPCIVVNHIPLSHLIMKVLGGIEGRFHL